MNRVALIIGLVSFAHLTLTHRSIGQERKPLAAIRELKDDTVTFDAKTIVEECTRLLAERDKHRPEAVARALFQRGFAYADLRKHAAALLDFDDLIKLKPEMPASHFARADMLGQLGRPAEAMAASREGLTLAPQAAEGHMSIAMRMIQQGKLKTASEWLEKALAIDPRLAGAHMLRAQIYEEVDRAKCLESLNKYLELVPEALILDAHPEDLLVMRGTALLHLNRPREALSSILAARRVKADSSPVIFRKLAITYGDLGRFHLAAHYARECIRGRTGSGGDYVILAYFSAKAGDEKAAQQALDKAISMARDESIFVSAGDTCFELGRYSDALRHFNMALDKEPQFPPAQMAAASFLATCPDAKYRDAKRAVKLSRDAYNAGAWQEWYKWRPAMALAEALAEDGNFADAAYYAREAVVCAGPEFGRRKEFLQKLAAFEKKKAWRVTIKSKIPSK